MQDIFIEYLVKKQGNIQTTLLKLLIVLGTVIVLIAAFLFGGALGSLSFLVPLIVIGAVYGAYYLITSMNIEFEYAVTNGELDIDQIISQRKRKRIISIDCKAVEGFGKYKAAEHQNKSYQTKVFACDHPQNPALYYCIVRLAQSGLTLVVFNANEKMLGAIKPFLPRPIMHEAFKTGR